MKKLNILHIISSLSPSRGGPTQSVLQLCKSLHKLDQNVHIATLQDTDISTYELEEFPIHSFPLKFPKKLRRSPDFFEFINKEIINYDLIHAHGLWEWPSMYARKAANNFMRPLVISPRGMLEPWSINQNKLVKKIAMIFWENENLKSANLLHATSISEANQFIKLGLSNKVTVIPNGIDFPEFINICERSTPTVLFLSRFHKKKGADLLLQAWATLSTSDWKLILAGPDPDGLRPNLEALATDLGVREQVSFLGPHYGSAKWELFRKCHLFVLPSHSENFGNVVPEALSQGLPVIATQGTPWSELENRGCGWWVPATVTDLALALKSAIALPKDTLFSMGQRGQTWAQTTFSAESTAGQMLQQYLDLTATYTPRL